MSGKNDIMTKGFSPSVIRFFNAQIILQKYLDF
jgi:hypothetical protein